MRKGANKEDTVCCETCCFCVWDTFKEIFFCNHRESDWFREEVFTTDHCRFWMKKNR